MPTHSNSESVSSWSCQATVAAGVSSPTTSTRRRLQYPRMTCENVNEAAKTPTDWSRRSLPTGTTDGSQNPRVEMTARPAIVPSVVDITGPTERGASQRER